LEMMDIDEFCNKIKTGSKVILEKYHVELKINIQRAFAFQSYNQSLQGAIHNIIMNAVQANAKKITMNVKTITLNKINTIEFIIKDDGCGMSEAVAQQALQPFFTTRASGTGLGLSVVHAIVQAHNGSITLSSHENKGTEITIHIPWLG